MAKYQEASGRHVYKTTETYKGITWECKGTSYKGAMQAEKAWQRSKEKKIAKINGEVEKKTGRVKLAKDLPDFYNLYLRNKPGKGGRPRSALTVRTDEETIRQIIKDMGEVLVCDIDSDRLQRYFNGLAARGASASVIRKRWIIFNRFFDKIKPGENPLSKCEKPQSQKKDAKWTVEDDSSEEKRAYTSEEMAQLAKTLIGITDTLTTERGQLLIIIMYQFLRLAEGVELRVKDIDFHRNIMHIRRQYDERHKIVAIPKYNSKRDLPIAAECRDILLMACAGKQAGDLVFCGDKYDQHDSRILRGALRDTLTLACHQAKLERHTIHDLRHDGITCIVNKGAKPQSVQRWAGHSALSITLDIYYRHNGQEDADDMKLT